LAKLESVAAGKRALENDMALPSNYSDGAKVKKILASIAGLDEEASALNEEWMQIADELSADEPPVSL